MQSLLRSTLRLCRRPSVFPGPTVQRDPPLKSAASALPDKLLDRLSRFAYEPWNAQLGIGVGSEKKVKLDGTIKVMDVAETSKEIKDGYANYFKVTDDIWPATICQGSSHRDGSIYTGNWEEAYSMDIADRDETVLERRKKLSTNFDCYPDQETCICHGPDDMIQIFSLSLAKTPINSGPIQLYGYMAARDDIDGKLNYVFNHSRDDPVIVQQGSLLEMTGPKRGIVMVADLLFEFDMRIKTGEKEEDDIQLIDGVTHYNDRMTPLPITVRISGKCGGAVDMSFSLVQSAVEAVIEVVILEVKSTFDLCLSSIVYVADLCKAVKLFHGAACDMA
ncbi:hypothetical protein EJB05_04156, partial [Eragrostis curvula]